MINSQMSLKINLHHIICDIWQLFKIF